MLLIPSLEGLIEWEETTFDTYSHNENSEGRILDSPFWTKVNVRVLLFCFSDLQVALHSCPYRAMCSHGKMSLFTNVSLKFHDQFYQKNFCMVLLLVYMGGFREKVENKKH